MSKQDRKGLVPKLQFPEFRDTGEWDIKPLSKIGEIITGNTPSTANLDNYGGNRLFVSPADISDERYVHTTKTTLSEQGFKQTRQIKTNSILFVCIGSTIGKVAQNKFECATNQQINSLVPFAEYSSDFIYSILEYSSKKISSLAGNHAVPIINKTVFSSILIRFPSLAEQQKIADCLASLDDRITAETQKLDTLKAHKKGLMQQLFPAEVQTLPQLRFPEFRDALEGGTPSSGYAITLGEVVEVASGQVDPTEPSYCDLPHIGGENIESHTGNLQGIMTARELRLISGKYLFDERDVLYSKIRPALNKVALPYFKGICSADIYPLRPSNDRLCRQYLAYLLLSEDFLEYAKKHSDRSKIPKINRDSLLAYKVAIPAQLEQQKISDCLASLDELITLQAQKIDTLKLHKKGLMQQLFPSLEEASR